MVDGNATTVQVGSHNRFSVDATVISSMRGRCAARRQLRFRSRERSSSEVFGLRLRVHVLVQWAPRYSAGKDTRHDSANSLP